MAKRVSRKTAAAAEVVRDEQGYEMVQCACTYEGSTNHKWTRLLYAGGCGQCGSYTCEWCSAHLDHPATPCAGCAPAFMEAK